MSGIEKNRVVRKSQRELQVILAHLYGTPAKIDEIKEICDFHQVPLIEDAAESLGATYKGKQTGTFGKYSALSLVVLKNRTRKEYTGISKKTRKLHKYAGIEGFWDMGLRVFNQD